MDNFLIRHRSITRSGRFDRQSAGSSVEPSGQIRSVELLRDENEPHLRLSPDGVHALGQSGIDPLPCGADEAELPAAVGAQAIEAQAARLRLRRWDAVPAGAGRGSGDGDGDAGEARLWAALALSQAEQRSSDGGAGEAAKLAEDCDRGVQLSKGPRLPSAGAGASKVMRRREAASGAVAAQRPADRKRASTLLSLARGGKTDAPLTLTELLGSVTGDEKPLVVAGAGVAVEMRRCSTELRSYQISMLIAYGLWSADGSPGPAHRPSRDSLLPLTIVV